MFDTRRCRFWNLDFSRPVRPFCFVSVHSIAESCHRYSFALGYFSMRILITPRNNRTKMSILGTKRICLLAMEEWFLLKWRNFTAQRHRRSKIPMQRQSNVFKLSLFIKWVLKHSTACEFQRSWFVEGSCLLRCVWNDVFLKNRLTNEIAMDIRD